MSIAIAPISSIVCILGHFFHFSGQPGVIFHILQNVVKMMILMSINHKPFHLRLWASQFAPKICSLQVLMCNYLFSANQDVQLFVLCKSRSAIISRIRLTTGTDLLEDDVWLNIHHGAGSYTVDIPWISNGYPSWNWMKAVSTIPLQLTTWSGYLVVKCWGAKIMEGRKV